MGLKIAGIAILVLMIFGSVFYWYYNDTQERMAVLQQNNAKLETAIAISEETVSTLQSDFRRANEELSNVNRAFAAARQQNSLLSSKLERHELGYLASRRPGLVERTVNRASAKAGRCFELLSGATLTEEEANAKDANSFNSECPWLWTGSATP